MIIVIRRNIDKVSGFPDIVLGDIYNRPNLLIKHKRRPPNQSCIKENVFKINFFRAPIVITMHLKSLFLHTLPSAESISA